MSLIVRSVSKPSRIAMQNSIISMLIGTEIRCLSRIFIRLGGRYSREAPECWEVRSQRSFLINFFLEHLFNKIVGDDWFRLKFTY